MNITLRIKNIDSDEIIQNPYRVVSQNSAVRHYKPHTFTICHIHYKIRTVVVKNIKCTIHNEGEEEIMICRTNGDF